jgi:hypothetical protein
VHFTENTILSGDLITEPGDIAFYKKDDWQSTPEGEDRQAREMMELYETLFADPYVEAITHWDATDGKWLNAPSGILRRDNSPKPIYDALADKIKRDWRTAPMKLVSGADGKLEFTGFRGRYALTINGETKRFTLDGKNDEIMIKV